MSLLNLFSKKRSCQKIEEIDGIKFKFRKNPLSKCVRISLKSQDSVLVTLPRRASFEYARNFALKNLNNIKNAAKKICPKVYCLDSITYATKDEFLKKLRTKAKDYLPKRLDEIAHSYGYKYNKLALKYMKTRWGSCSFKNNINLNICLMTLENELIDYVLLHELVHTVEKNVDNFPLSPFFSLSQGDEIKISDFSFHKGKFVHKLQTACPQSFPPFFSCRLFSKKRAKRL